MLRILEFQRLRIIHESKGYNERRETMNRVILSLKNIDKTYGKEQVLNMWSYRREWCRKDNLNENSSRTNSI